jgi:hypothetical protein
VVVVVVVLPPVPVVVVVVGPVVPPVAAAPVVVVVLPLPASVAGWVWLPPAAGCVLPGAETMLDEFDCAAESGVVSVAQLLTGTAWPVADSTLRLSTLPVIEANWPNRSDPMDDVGVKITPWPSIAITP